jgi:prophage maintenance system killer protein
MNGAKLEASNKEIAELFLDLAASRLTREEVEQKFTRWVILNRKADE